MHDTAYTTPAYPAIAQVAHHYGPNVYLLADPVGQTLLNTLSQPQTTQPQITGLVRQLYQILIQAAVNTHWPQITTQSKTRMHTTTADNRGIWHGCILDPAQHAVTVDIARAGTVPSQWIFESLCALLRPENLRQDHIYMNRVTDAQGHVVGVDVSGSKIGGPAQDALVFFPDPMGATGTSMVRAMNMYKNLPDGAPKAMIALHLIVTPEYLKTLVTHHPDACIYAMRLDRGMSAEAIFQTPLGRFWAEEKGLNDRQYIIPGAGGLGEILNNSYV